MKKALFYKALLLPLILAFVSCKTQDQKYKAFYEKIQLKTATKVAEVKDKDDCCELPNVISQEINDMNKSLDEWEKVVFAPRKHPEEEEEEMALVQAISDSISSAKDSISSLRKKEIAAIPVHGQRVSSISRNEVPVAPPAEPEPPVVPEAKVEIVPVEPSTPPVAFNPPPAKVDEPKPVKETPEHVDSTPDVVRSVDVKVISGNGNLKKYNVVIASLSKLEGANRLKALFFAETNEKFWIAMNAKNIHYFIVGSFDTKEDAIRKKNQLISDYTSRYTKSQLLQKYGIPFADAWILERP